MAEGVREEAWQHTAWLAAMIANANRDPKKRPRPFQPAEFNPLVQADKRRRGAVLVDKDTIADMKAMFGQLGKKEKS